MARPPAKGPGSRAAGELIDVAWVLMAGEWAGRARHPPPPPPPTAQCFTERSTEGSTEGSTERMGGGYYIFRDSLHGFQGGHSLYVLQIG
jgi:hypothetical protein